MSILSKISALPQWATALISSAGGVAAAVTTWFWSDYTTFRNAQNEINKSTAEQSIKSDSDLDPFIVKFKNLVVGKGEVTDKDRDEFTDALRLSQSHAADLKNRYPSLQAPFETYTTSLVGLKQSLSNLNGPIDGKKYVTALGRYFVAQAKWRQEVTRAQTAYWRSFAFR
ncbi:hypothetical protein MKK88_17635 [Methylobacterium sp. E-005]|uniref:hypothetical protein n=1 Tax=Methylobacterium sp. E-005 TaxID=2836549 RepID=UPI001FBA4C47|nr:hypothetical protein [Methylobacterium sp. E-005]MCJ2087788.1 hypothetical protein [Methylobacterium sp. E-005]